MMNPPPAHLVHPSRGHIQDPPENEEEGDDLDEDEEYSDDNEEFQEEFSDEDPEVRRAANDLFNFGNSLQVKGKPRISRRLLWKWLAQFKIQPGGILTVADDLLKNDGKKFIEMMEQLAERRMQREEEALYAASGHPSYQGSYGHNHEAAAEDEELDEEEEDYDSQEDDVDDEEDDMVRVVDGLPGPLP